MPRFFNKIRQSLAVEGRFRKYVLYAIGEIVLVVIGILIALQVGTINESRQRRELERKVLTEISKALEGDLFDIRDEYESFQLGLRKDSMLIQYFRQKLPYQDSIGAALQVLEMSPHFSVSGSGYKLLQAKGIDLISNDTLRISVSDMYEIEYPYYYTYADERMNLIETQIKPYLNKHFYLEHHTEWPYYKRVPHSYETLLQDPELISLIQSSYYHAKVMSRNARILEVEMVRLRERIDRFLLRP